MPIVPSSYPTAAPSEQPSSAPTAFEIDNHVALRRVYEAMGGASWTGGKNANWMVGLPCEDGWAGVDCTSSDSELPSAIVKLKLGRVGAVGTIPTEVGLLTDLDALWFSSNDLTGTVPSELGLLGKANTVYISKNSLEGTLPEELGNLSHLRHLLAYSNLLTGSLPTTLASITTISRLRVHDIEGLCGILPDFLHNVQELS